MDISLFTHDLEKYFLGRSLCVELEPSNRFVYISCNVLFDDDVSFIEKFGLRFFSVCPSSKEGFSLDVCFAIEV